MITEITIVISDVRYGVACILDNYRPGVFYVSNGMWFHQYLEPLTTQYTNKCILIPESVSVKIIPPPDRQPRIASSLGTNRPAG